MEDDDNGPQAEDFLWSLGVGEALPEWLKELRKKERAQGLNQGPRKPGRSAPRPGFGPSHYGTPSPASPAGATPVPASSDGQGARPKAAVASSAPPGREQPTAPSQPAGPAVAARAVAKAEPPQERLVEEKRIDPEDEKAYSLAELMVRYKGTFSVQEIEAYFQSDCKPLPTASPPAPTRAEVPKEEAKVPERPPSDSKSQEPAATSLAIKEWLLSLDDGGFMAQYHDTLTSNFDSLEQIRDIYVKGDELQKSFFDDVGIKKLGHKRLFEKWFKEHTP